MCSFIHFNWLTLGVDFFQRLIEVDKNANASPRLQTIQPLSSYTIFHVHIVQYSELSVIYIINRWANDEWIEW